MSSICLINKKRNNNNHMGFMRIQVKMLTLNAIIQIKVNNFQYYHCYYVENHGKRKKKRSARVRRERGEC